MRKQLRLVAGDLVLQRFYGRGPFRALRTFDTHPDCLANVALSVVERPNYHFGDNLARRFCYFGTLALHVPIRAESGHGRENLPYLHAPLYSVWHLCHAEDTTYSAGPSSRVNSHWRSNGLPRSYHIQSRPSPRAVLYNETLLVLCSQ